MKYNAKYYDLLIEREKRKEEKKRIKRSRNVEIVKEITKQAIPDELKNVKLNELQKKYISYRKRMIKRGLEYDISFESFEKKINGKCKYCGEKANAVDRIDSSKGYTERNTQPICNMCNHMKFTYSETDFINKIKKICSNIKDIRYLIR